MPRTSAWPIDPVVLARWSPLAFAETPLDHDDLMPLFEAARWAPSAFNAQPWRFAYALRGDAAWQCYLDSLLPFNRAWAGRAGAIVYVLSQTEVIMPGQSEPGPAITASFDAGAAWGYLALQATRQGLATHAMAGFDAARAREVIGCGADLRIETAIAVGHEGDRADLPEALRARDVLTDRLPLDSLVFHGALSPAIEA